METGIAGHSVSCCAKYLDLRIGAGSEAFLYPSTLQRIDRKRRERFRVTKKKAAGQQI